MTTVEWDVTSPACPSRVIFSRIGDRWTMFIVLALSERTMRFSELKERLGQISPKVLTETLRALEADGLLERRSFPDSPPRVKYSLTGLGRSLLEPIAAMRVWAEEHVPEVLESRRRALSA
ncbi:MAG: winged helix-turn-helix transcriptional regulator [Microbacterium sp.]|uniref:winged helix-turn-helix transcriptional regulator n=1 Tax=Microbacterium sp. TaxID=51671 RepID=UPI003F81A22C